MRFNSTTGSGPASLVAGLLFLSLVLQPAAVACDKRTINNTSCSINSSSSSSNRNNPGSESCSTETYLEVDFFETTGSIESLQLGSGSVGEDNNPQKTNTSQERELRDGDEESFHREPINDDSSNHKSSDYGIRYIQEIVFVVSAFILAIGHVGIGWIFRSGQISGDKTIDTSNDRRKASSSVCDIRSKARSNESSNQTIDSDEINSDCSTDVPSSGEVLLNRETKNRSKESESESEAQQYDVLSKDCAGLLKRDKKKSLTIGALLKRAKKKISGVTKIDPRWGEAILKREKKRPSMELLEQRDEIIRSRESDGSSSGSRDADPRRGGEAPRIHTRAKKRPSKEQQEQQADPRRGGEAPRIHTRAKKRPSKEQEQKQGGEAPKPSRRNSIDPRGRETLPAANRETQKPKLQRRKSKRQSLVLFNTASTLELGNTLE